MRGRDFDRKFDAERWGREQEASMDAGDWTDPARAKITVGKLSERWLASLDVKPKTRASYESLLPTCVLPHWGAVRLDRVETSAVTAWVAGMSGSRGPLSASRRQQAYHVLAAVLDVAVMDRRITKNPARDIGRLPRLPEARPALPVPQ